MNAFSFSVPGVPYQEQERPKTIPPLPAALFVVPFDRVLREVCQAYSFTLEQLTGAERWQCFMAGRLTAYWLLRTVCKLSFPQIGRVMGNRDHTTIINGVRSAEKRRAKEPMFLAQTDMLADRLRGTVVA